MKGPYRIGLDVGTNSIGWCIYRLDDNDAPIALLRSGVRIFSDGRKKDDLSSLAAERRKARQARRRRDRLLSRQHHLVGDLIRFGLMPEDDGERLALSTLDPYELRSNGVDQPLTPHQFGRTIYHLAKRRGFRSSRKTKGEDDKDSGKVKGAIKRTEQAMDEAGCTTLGQYLAHRRKQGLPVRARRDPNDEYLLYPQRDLVAKEFDILWEKQASYHPAICTEPARAAIRHTLLLQRPLRPVEPGRCQFEPDQPRIPKCSPLFERYRILCDVNHLRIRRDGEESLLTLEQRDTLADALARHADRKPIPFADMAKRLKLPRGASFNFEKDRKRTGFKGDATAPIAAAIGDRWTRISDLQQEALAVLLEMAPDNELLLSALSALPKDIGPAKQISRSIEAPQRIQPWLDALSRLPFAFDQQAVAALLAVGHLPDDYGSLSRKAIEHLLPFLEAEVITYDQAVAKSRYVSHSDFYTGEIRPRLPYYGKVLAGYVSPHPRRYEVATEPNDDDPKQMHLVEKYFGRIPNPTVHVGLVQLRLLVNAMIKRWGPPREINIELTREFGMSGRRRKELKDEQDKNRKRNDKINAELRKLGQRENRENRHRYLLWEELGGSDPLYRACVYSGRKLCLTDTTDSLCVFSSDVEVDHLLPFSRTLDDSLTNKVLCATEANRIKGNRSPHEAFSGGMHGFDWQSIVERSRDLPANKAKRFKEDAVETALGERGFLARHLNDTAYLSRVAREYLTTICPPQRVRVTSGRLTGMLRAIWGLNDPSGVNAGRKYREDHRHHALDAAVIGACDERTLQAMSQAARNAEDAGQNRKFKQFPPPWPDFRERVLESYERITVSHKPDHGVQGGLHNETNYGMREPAAKKGDSPKVWHRVAIESIELNNVEIVPGKTGRPSAKVANPALREQLYALLRGKTPVEARQALLEFSRTTGIRRVRVEERLSVVGIRDRYGERREYRYVATAGNHCLLIWRNAKGQWRPKVITTFRANANNFDLRRETGPDGEPVVLRLRKEDMLVLEENGVAVVRRVVKISEKSVFLADHREANPSADKKLKEWSPEQLRKAAARSVGVDPLGYVNDPGFRS
ncbi:MAG: type II CRISPR RNA-guided endonuclease Cas9 [Lysobacteraceae bacterium]|nr:MAG: type II CRISPR RNA-guided endonuclease Cas9 [Xanthomonadaceae bacterium]